MRTFVLCTAALSAALLLLDAAPRISEWERAHGYPFGQMCNSVFTAFTNTCKVH